MFSINNHYRMKFHLFFYIKSNLILLIFIRDDAIKYLSTTNNQNKPYTLVFYDPCYRHAIEEYSPKSSHLIFSKIDTHNSTDSSDFSLYNRSVQLPLPFNPSNYSIIFISYSKSSLHSFALYFHSYDFHSFPTNSVTSSKLLSKRMYAIECARNSSSYGLLLSSNSLLNLPITIHQLLDQVKSVLKNQNRQYYTFLMNTISITKLNNFEQNIDVYVLCSSCSESSWLSPEHKQFNIPLISITDLVYALDMNEEYYSFDLKQISSTIKMNENRTEDEENNAVVLKNPNSLLLTQRDGLNRGLLNNQTWWGLQITDNNTNDDDDENKEKNSIAELKEGKSGIASGYSHEKF